jgi:periplasmic protein TonB
MDFAQQQRNPTRHLVGMAFVILLHLFVIYALVTGLARNAVEVIKKPLTATIIDEVKIPPPPPPPPPRKIIEPPKVQAPVEPYVPPPDIPVPTPPSEPVISAPTTTVPTEQHVIAPPVPAPPPKPAIRKGITPLVKVEPIYPREAIRAGIAKGRVVARLFIDEKGLVSEVRIIESDPPGVFNKEVTRALSQWKFQAEGEKFVGEVELTFTLKDE